MLAVIAMAAAVAYALTTAPQIVRADENAITVSAPSGVVLTVGGRVIEEVPAVVEAGREVCAGAIIVYVSEFERMVFQKWDHGPTDSCVTLNAPGTYRAVFESQVLIQVRSPVPSERQSLWLAVGAPVKFEAPEIVATTDRIRDRFLEWSAGETPFRASTVYIPLRPGTIELKRVREYVVVVEGAEGSTIPGTGWYAEGADVFVTTPETIPVGHAGERWRFSEWSSDAFPPINFTAPKSALSSFKVGGTFVVRPKYVREYLVEASNPSGNLLSRWAAAGERIELETPPTIDVVPDRERWRFSRWEGLQGITTPKIVGVINDPVKLVAIYDREVKISVIAPYGGTQSDWYPVGTTVTISVAPSGQSKLVFVNRFKEFAGTTIRRPSTQLIAQTPTTFIAVYESQVNLVVLTLLGIFPVSVIGLYLAYRWLLAFQASRRFRY